MWYAFEALTPQHFAQGALGEASAVEAARARASAVDPSKAEGKR